MTSSSRMHTLRARLGTPLVLAAIGVLALSAPSPAQDVISKKRLPW